MPVAATLKFLILQITPFRSMPASWQNTLNMFLLNPEPGDEDRPLCMSE